MSFRVYLDGRENKWIAERNNVEFTKNNLSIDQIYSIIISSIPSDRHTFIFLSEKKKNHQISQSNGSTRSNPSLYPYPRLFS